MSKRMSHIHMRELHEMALPYFRALHRVTGIEPERVIGYRRAYELTDARCVLAYLLRHDLRLDWRSLALVVGIG